MTEEDERDPFCNKEQIIKQAYYESRHTYVLYNLYPVVKGHSLIVPKRHVTDLMQLTDKEAEDLLKTMRHVIPVLLKAYKCESSYNIVAQIGEYSGRSVEHLHIHIIPRNKFDVYQDYNDKLYADLRKYELRHLAMHEIRNEVAKLRKLFHYKPKKI